jgi:phosphoketolase
MREDMLAQIARYRRAANFLAATQVYLQDNCLLEEPLRPEHIKPRLLGHWGTAPGINLIYAHLNRLIRDHDANVLLITGPGAWRRGQPGEPLPGGHAQRVLPRSDTRSCGPHPADTRLLLAGRLSRPS